MVELRLPPGGAGGERLPVLPPVDGPCWTSDCLAISRDWVAFREKAQTYFWNALPRAVSWNVVPYAEISSMRPFNTFGIVYIQPDGSGVVIGSAVLASLEACTLLAEGLSTNPAVAPDAATLLRPYLEAARARRQSSLARVHTVDRSGTTHTFRLHHGKQVAIGVAWLVMAAFFLGTPIVGLVVSGAPRGVRARQLVLVAGFGLICLWEGIRSFRIEAQVSGQRLTIRNALRTHTVDSDDIRAITLQPHSDGQSRTSHWIARADLTGGKSIWISSLDCGPAGRSPEPDLTVAVEEFRALLGVAAGDIVPPESANSRG